MSLRDTRMAPKLEGTGLSGRAVGSAFLGLRGGGPAGVQPA